MNVNSLNNIGNTAFFDDNGRLNNINLIKDDKIKLNAIVKEFEAMFYQELLKERKIFDDDKDNLFSSSASKEYKDMFAKQAALKLSESRSLGIGKYLLKQIEKTMRS